MPRLAQAFAIPTLLRPPQPHRHALARPYICAMSLLKGRNAVITGATRGIGRGLALAFGEQGANVYITGRTKGPGPGSLEDVAKLIRDAGGNCEYFVVDHADDKQIEDLFEQLAARLATDGSKLDFFINNAYAAVGFIMESMDVPFWKKSAHNPAVPDSKSNPGEVWDLVNGVGLRNNFVCATHAVRMMEPHASGVIVNITSWGGLSSIFDPAYSIGKEAVERMSAEIASAAPDGVKSIAFCPGYVSTEELVKADIKSREKARAEGRDPHSTDMPTWNSESPLFVGRVLAALLSAKGERLLPSMNGKVAIAAEVANVLNVTDENGCRPLSFRSLKFNILSGLPFLIESPLAKLIPASLYAPWPLVIWIAGTRKFW